jgi:hypothetical protein
MISQDRFSNVHLTINDDCMGLGLHVIYRGVE